MTHPEGKGARPPLQEAFARTRDEILAVHRDLERLKGEAARDPLAELELAEQIDELHRRRDELFRRWARIGLSWLLRGGKVEAIVTGAVLTEPGKEARAEGADEERQPLGPVRVSADRTFGRVEITALGSWARAREPKPEVSQEEAIELLRPLSPMPDVIEDRDAVYAELMRLAEATAPERTDRWRGFPKDAQRALVGHVVARARHIQDELPDGLFDQAWLPTLDRVFSSMTGYSKREQPGFVFGLQRSHVPVRATWKDDAIHWWGELERHLPIARALNPDRALDELRRVIDEEEDEEKALEAASLALEAGVSPEDPRIVRLMIPYQEALRKQARFKRLRKAIRLAIQEDEASEQELAADNPPVPADSWPWWGRTRDRRAVVVGGDLPLEARERIKSAFGFQALDWALADSTNDLKAVAKGIENGAHDVVIVLRRFAGPDVDRLVVEPAEQHGVSWVSVDRGYGISQIRRAIERHLEPA